ncbi:alpha/beta-hydrolase [Serendipita vermifera]|nr:alpha/beta-hydrolase [Serendipita vermifera]
MNENSVTLKNGRTYHYIDQQIQHSAPKATLLCLHGFPDQWYGWKSQIKTWALAGYRVIVPHMLGYGSSDKPKEASAYSLKNLTTDLHLLLQHLGLHRVVVVAHDWGAAVAWRFVMWYPSSAIALITLSVPFFPVAKKYTSPSEASKRVPTFGYQEYFADPSSTKAIEENLDVFLTAIFQVPSSSNSANNERMPLLRPGQLQQLFSKGKGAMPPLAVSYPEWEQYKRDFEKGGMDGPLSYYRNTLSRFEDEKDKDLHIPPSLPVLFIYGDQDRTCPGSYVDRMPSLIENLKIVKLEGAGHWLFHEAEEAVDREILEFIDREVEKERQFVPLAAL